MRQKEGRVREPQKVNETHTERRPTSWVQWICVSKLLSVNTEIHVYAELWTVSLYGRSLDPGPNPEVYHPASAKINTSLITFLLDKDSVNLRTWRSKLFREVQQKHTHTHKKTTQIYRHRRVWANCGLYNGQRINVHLTPLARVCVCSSRSICHLPTPLTGNTFVFGFLVNDNKSNSQLSFLQLQSILWQLTVCRA